MYLETTVAEYEGTKEESILEPQVVATPSTQKLSLTASGTHDSAISGEKAAVASPSEGVETTTAFWRVFNSPFSDLNCFSNSFISHRSFCFEQMGQWEPLI